MSRSIAVLLLAGLIGVPCWLLPDARETLGSTLFLVMVALSVAGSLLSVGLWIKDGR